MDYPTFNERSDAGGVRTPKVNATTASYADGYEQVVFSGRNKYYDTLALTFTRNYNVTKAIYETLLQYAINRTPFFYSFNAIEPARMFTVDYDSLNHTHVSGLQWSVSVKFTQWSGI